MNETQHIILIIEDDESHNNAYRTAFESEGYSVSVATTVSRGLSLATELKPDLILLDVMLPGGEN